MSWLLRFDGVNDSVSLGSAISVTGDGELFRFDFVYNGEDRVFLGGTDFNNFFRYTGSSLGVRIAGTETTFDVALTVGQRYEIIAERSGSTLTLKDGATVLGSAACSTGNFVVGRIGSFHNGTSTSPIDLYSLNVGNSSAIYNPSASSGTGSTLIDTVGGNNGTLINFPADDSQWVSYGASPPTLSTPTATATTANSISFSIPVTY